MNLRHSLEAAALAARKELLARPETNATPAGEAQFKEWLAGASDMEICDAIRNYLFCKEEGTLT